MIIKFTGDPKTRGYRGQHQDSDGAWQTERTNKTS